MKQSGIDLPKEWTLLVSSGLRFDITTVYESRIFDAFFEGYDRAFVLPAEKEGRDGFRDCLILNHGPRHAEIVAAYGPFAELCLVARDSETDLVIGGANLITLLFNDDGRREALTANLNYVYVDPNARGKGYLGRILVGIRELIASLFPTTAAIAPLIFIEQNDPLAMTDQAYQDDTAHAGIDQFDRLLAWAKVGAWLVDFPYVQPGLSAEQGADETLVYAILSPPAPTLAPSILAGHLRRFFAISVLKGATDRGSEVIARQEHDLASRIAAHELINLIDPKPLLIELARHPDRWSFWNERPDSLIDAARAHRPNL